MMAAMNAAVTAAFAALLFATSSIAQDLPVPKIVRGVEGQKGQYKVEFLEGAAAGRASTMTVCTDNLLRDSAAAKGKPRAESECKHRLLKDTSDEAVMESVCKERTSTVSMKREGASMLMTVESTGPRGPQTMKMRYTHLGPCREGQGAVSLDKNSEECRKIREQAAKMDPAKQCARAKSDREACEQRMREAQVQVAAMCS
jgi:hypothetical protein